MAYAGRCYSNQGALLCGECFGLADIDETTARAAKSLRNAGYGSLFPAALSLIFNPLFIVSILAIASSGSTLNTLIRSEEYRSRLGGHLGPVIVACVASLLFSLALCGFALLRVVLWAAE